MNAYRVLGGPCRDNGDNGTGEERRDEACVVWVTIVWAFPAGQRLVVAHLQRLGPGGLLVVHPGVGILTVDRIGSTTPHAAYGLTAIQEHNPGWPYEVWNTEISSVSTSPRRTETYLAHSELFMPPLDTPQTRGPEYHTHKLVIKKVSATVSNVRY